MIPKVGKTFPKWITQILSFSMAPIQDNKYVWKNLGLKMEDCVVQINVTIKEYSELMQEGDS
jgi:hypothetical protein